jgi:hypothetical protein
MHVVSIEDMIHQNLKVLNFEVVTLDMIFLESVMRSRYGTF